MGYQFIGGQMVWVPDNVTPEEVQQINQDIAAGRTPSTTQNMSNEEITKLMTVVGRPAQLKQPETKTTPTPVPVPEIIKQEQRQAAEQARKESLRQALVQQAGTTTAKVTSSIPFDRKYYEAIDFGNNQGRAIYRALTPWREEEGETIGKWVINIPNRMTSVPEQEKLKEQYEAEHSQPLWSRILFGGDTVYKDKKGDYYQVIAGEAPLVSGVPAGRINLSNKAIKDVLKAIDKANLEDWEKVAINYMRRGNIKDVPSSVAILRNQGMNIVNDVKYGEFVPRTAADILADKIDDFKAYERIWLASQKYIQPATKASQQLSVFGIPLPMTISTPSDKKAIDNIADKAATMDPDKALKVLTETEVFPIITISHPEVVTKIIEKAEPETQKEIITDVEEAIKEAVKTKTLTKEQEKQINKIIHQVNEQIEEQTETEAKPKEQTQTKTQTKTEVKTKTDTKEKTSESAGSRSPDDKVPGEGPGTGGSLRSPKLDMSYEGQKAARKVIKESDGAIAWNMGELHKKRLWYVVVNPYTSNENLIVLFGKKPEGATIVRKGKGSAYGSTQVVRGIAPKRDVNIDSGIADITISPVGKRSVKMKVTADPKQETKGDITIGRSRISERPLRLYTPGGLPRKAKRIAPKGHR